MQGVGTTLLNDINVQNGSIVLSDKELISEVANQQNIFIRILEKNGKVSDISSKFNYEITSGEPYDQIIRLEQGDNHLEYKNIKVEIKNYGTAYIQIVKDMNTEHSLLYILFIFMAASDFIGVIASIIVGYIVSKRLLKPIDAITKTAENITINNLKERIDVNGPDDELKRLGVTFNKMTDRLQEAFDRQSQFVSDASHELRTPIAVIQGYANLLDRWGKNDREALEKSISAIKQEADNMANLVEKLLFLAKGDTENQILEKKEFRLSGLIDEIVNESRLIDSKHVISSSRNDEVSIFADYKRIKQMLRIFVDNSIKFAPEHSNIDISSEILGKKVKITVTDSGIGIGKDDINKIFDRFYTADKSRSKETGGTGLGLPIAKGIAEMHNGEITVESEKGKYTRITVLLNIKE